MISNKELQYIDKSARQVPFPGIKYATETFENMITMYDKYNKYYKGKEYNIIFSDATEILFEILEQNICHMLGIDFKNLTSGYYNEFLTNVLNLNPLMDHITSYDLTSRILNDYEKVINYDANTQYRVINYYKSRVKCAIFDKLSKFENFNFGKLDTQDETKILYTPSNEAICPYYLIRIIKNNNEERYIINSLIAPPKEELKDYFNQTCAIPTQIIIDDNKNLNKIEATASEKIALLNLYKAIITEYNSNDNINISGDYLAILAEEENKVKKRI